MRAILKIVEGDRHRRALGIGHEMGSAGMPVDAYEADGTAADPDNNRFRCRREIGSAVLRRLDPPRARR